MNFFEKIFRFGIIAIGLIVEVIIVRNLFLFFTEHFVWIEMVLRLFSILLVMYIINNSRHLSADMLWVLLIILFPIPGTALFLLLGANLIISKTFLELIKNTVESKKYFVQDKIVLEEVEEIAPHMKGDFYYLSKTEGYPIYRNSNFDYYALGDLGYPVMLEEMKKAESFIFLEYFTIEKGKLWECMHTILKEKVTQGLDVRVMYDDMETIHSLPPNYANMLESEGIKCVRYNKINPFLGVVMNHRDHRKIMVIDGKVAFSGGMNLADEYINQKMVFGHWKDNVIRVKGEAVWSYTVLFLVNWNAIRKTDDDYTVFKVDAKMENTDGYISPYGETPFDGENTGQNVYMNILNRANNYVYICTPYLIIDTELENALILAAKRGVDVRIITPGIPDKKMVWNITRSFYQNLIDGGVKIYEYTPGFIHGKVFVSDDIVATVGTINLDYRSLYLHFENGTYLYGSKKVLDIRDDMLDTFSKSHQIQKGEIKDGILHRLFVGFTKLFAPLL